jgi:hypothetical protein
MGEDAAAVIVGDGEDGIDGDGVAEGMQIITPKRHFCSHSR